MLTSPLPSGSTTTASIIGAIFLNESTMSINDPVILDLSEIIRTSWESPKWDPTKMYWDESNVRDVGLEIFK